jgi:hypothetical protein
MKSLSIFVLFLAGSFLPVAPTDAAEKRLTVVDYYLLLPRDYFEGTPADWLHFLKQPNCGVVDLANGYMSCIGDGAQPEFEVALFHYHDRRPLLAVCSGELEGTNSVYLDFFEMNPDGKMDKARRSLLPVGDAGNDKGDWRFKLPRHGHTVLIRDQRSGKILRRFTWNGEKFAEEK